MTLTKRITALMLISALFFCLFAGCTPSATPSEEPEETPKETSTPTAEPTETPVPTPEPTKTPKPKPTPTPEPTPQPEGLYSWEYREYEPGKLDVCIVVSEDVDPRDIRIVEVPAEIDGKKVTKLGYDFFGCRYPMFGGRKGFMRTTKRDDEGNPIEWNNDAECWVETVILPDTIEIMENGLFWFDVPTLKTLIFKGTDNIQYMSCCTFTTCPAEDIYAKQHDGFLQFGKILSYISPTRNIVLPDSVKIIAPRAFHQQNYSRVKTVIINEGCEEIGYGMLEDAEFIDWIYIPATVTTIGDYICNEKLASKLIIKTPAGSYAEQWAEEHGIKHEVCQSADEAASLLG